VTNGASKRWFPHRKALDAPRARLFCFPHAGGGAATFRDWSALVPGEVELCAVELPGRETRFSEPPVASMPALVPPLCDAIGDLRGVPFAFLGHSLGAVVAFEVARELQARGGAMVGAVVACGHRAPHLPPRERPIHGLPDAELELELKQLDGCPPEFWQHQELKELLLPVIRADLALAETYRCAPGSPLSCPILAFGGSDDEDLPARDLESWREHTSSEFRATILPGDHFFVRHRAHELTRAALDALGLPSVQYGARLPSPRRSGAG